MKLEGESETEAQSVRPSGRICQLACSEINPLYYGLWTWTWPLMWPPAGPVLPEVASDCLALRSSCGRPQLAHVN